MGYFDGNTAGALWRYAQHFALSDNHFATMFGESTRGDQRSLEMSPA
jgi:phospholipase C